MRIIPAIDIFDGKCVRLREGNFSARQVYSDDPLQAALRFIEAGATLLHVVDLDGARSGRVVNWEQLSAILALDGVDVQVGGGIRTIEDASRLIDAGASRIIVGSIAIRATSVFEQWVKRFGPDRFCAAVDIREGSLVSNGWQAKEEASVDEFVRRMQNQGVRAFLCTDVSRDGTLSGPNTILYEGMVRRFPSLEWIASGGVGAKDDLIALAKTKVAGVVVGKAFYEGSIKFEDLAEFKC